MLTGIDEKLTERLAVKEQEAPTPLRDAAIPVYREAAMYALEAGELGAYRTSMQANMDCKEAIEQTINDYYGNNRLRPAGNRGCLWLRAGKCSGKLQRTGFPGFM